MAEREDDPETVAKGDAAGQARGEKPKPSLDKDEKPCSPAEAKANADQTAQRAS